jgi:hypothetical protein
LVLDQRTGSHAPALEVLDHLTPTAPHGLWIGDRETLVWAAGARDRQSTK